MVKVLNEIRDFNLLTPQSGVRESVCRELITFKTSSEMEYQQLIVFQASDGDSVTMDLLGKKEGTKVKGLLWRNFSNAELIAIARQFSLILHPVDKKGNNDKLYMCIPHNSIEFSRTELAIKKSNHINNYFMVIFNLDYPDKTFVGEVLVYGIWEVQLREDFANKF
jgi:hypothetical protein